MLVNEQLKTLADDFAAKKISRRELWKGAAALGLTGAWIAALEKGATAAPAPFHRELRTRGQDAATTLIIAVAENVDTFDPGFTVGSKTAQTVIQNTFDQLTQYEIVEKTTPDGTAYKTVNTQNIVPMLAETYAVEGADMVFGLRADATFSNGDPIDSAALVTGYSRIIDTAAVSALLLGMGGGVTETSAFTAPDASTFKITMSKPNTLIPQNNVMHNTSILAPSELESNKTADDPWALAYFKDNLGIGNGPYKLESYKPDDSVVLVANEAYYGEQPVFTTVILKIVADATTRVQLLQAGDVDTATKIPVKDFAALKADPNIKVLSLPTTLVVMLELNNIVAPFDNKLVRQAVAYATPYQDIIDQIYEGQATVAKSLVPNGMPTSDFSTNVYELNYDKARELLAEAGFPDGEGLPGDQAHRRRRRCSEGANRDSASGLAQEYRHERRHRKAPLCSVQRTTARQ